MGGNDVIGAIGFGGANAAQGGGTKTKNRVRMAHRREKAREERTILKLQPGMNAKPIESFPTGHRNVYAWLDGKGWQRISDLVCALKGDSCVGRAPNGRKLKHKAIMWKLHRWVDDLVEGGLIGEDYTPFDRGPKMRCGDWIRSIDHLTTSPPHRLRAHTGGHRVCIGFLR